MAKDGVEQLDNKTQVFVWLLLSWVSTVAGNVTLIGSAANIIVAEKAMRHHADPTQVIASESQISSAKVYISSIHHFRVCGLVSIFVIAVGMIIIYIEAKMFGYL